jgi:hypothetical protein
VTQVKDVFGVVLWNIILGGVQCSPRRVREIIISLLRSQTYVFNKV